MKLMKIYVLCICFFVGVAKSAEEPFQLHNHYETAVSNTTSSESAYVLIKLVNAHTKKAKLVCLPSPLLMGAIHHEHDIPYDKSGHNKAKNIALSNSNHTFTFNKKRALKNIPMYYTNEDLERARKEIKSLSYNELTEGFSFRGKLHRLYVLSARSVPKRDALACALVERHIAVYLSGSGNLVTY